MVARSSVSRGSRRTMLMSLAAIAAGAPRGAAMAMSGRNNAATKGRLMSGPAAVTGTIEFPGDLPAGPPATIYVRIEDVSRADAPAVVLSSATLTAVPVPPPAGETVTFAVPVGDYDARMRYSVRIHVDRDGDGQVSVGDLVSTVNHPVLTQGAGMVVTVPVSVV